MTVACTRCGGEMILHFAPPVPHQAPQERLQAWVCPFCWQPNEGTFAATLESVTKGSPAKKPE